MADAVCQICLAIFCIAISMTTILAFPANKEIEEPVHEAPIRNRRDYTDNLFDFYSPEKRGPQLSINQDLMSIASMMRNDAHRRKMEGAQDFLARIGKRSFSEENDFDIDDLPARVQPQKREAYSQFSFPRTRRGRLSVSMPLDTLTDMIHTQRRQHLGGRMMQINRKLTRLG